jgi:signal transduction histidine kinase
MCGIVGYVGKQNCTDVLINSLSRLEYRGYDSAGIAVFENGEIKVEAFVSPKRSYLSVSDNGKGIDKENLDLIFNAFFTTKDVGKGTGLGLYLVKDLANKMGWQIDVSSEVGKGTEFKIFFI